MMCKGGLARRADTTRNPPVASFIIAQRSLADALSNQFEIKWSRLRLGQASTVEIKFATPGGFSAVLPDPPAR